MPIAGGGRGGRLPYIDYAGTCRCTGYGFRDFLSRTGYRKRAFLVRKKVSSLSKFKIKGSEKA